MKKTFIHSIYFLDPISNKRGELLNFQFFSTQAILFDISDFQNIKYLSTLSLFEPMRYYGYIYSKYILSYSTPSLSTWPWGTNEL